MKYVAPDITTTAFNCPYCGALASQEWFIAQASRIGGFPHLSAKGDADHINLSKIPRDEQEKGRQYKKHIERSSLGIPFLYNEYKTTSQAVSNVHLSSCYNCSNVAVWIYNNLVFPLVGTAPEANPDTPDEIKTDYNEASVILQASPRGAAALLRLAIQKLAVHLGGNGRKIDDDIKLLVERGIGAQIQRAMDVLRVIGNNAVHPGTMDMRDDRVTALSLFRLFNMIVEKTIAEQKHVDELYASLPPGALAAIEKRDGKKALPAPNSPPEEPT